MGDLNMNDENFSKNKVEQIEDTLIKLKEKKARIIKCFLFFLFYKCYNRYQNKRDYYEEE